MSKYVARLYQQNIDPSRRNLVAVIAAREDSKFALKLLKDNEVVIYEKVIDQMLACWYLDKDKLVYMEDLASRKIFYVKVRYGELGEVREFQLPAGDDDDIFALKNPITASLDPLIEQYPCEDKEVLRALITSETSQVNKAPELFIICSLPNKVFILTGNG